MYTDEADRPALKDLRMQMPLELRYVKHLQSDSWAHNTQQALRDDANDERKSYPV